VRWMKPAVKTGPDEANIAPPPQQSQ